MINVKKILEIICCYNICFKICLILFYMVKKIWVLMPTCNIVIITLENMLKVHNKNICSCICIQGNFQGHTFIVWTIPVQHAVNPNQTLIHKIDHI